MSQSRRTPCRRSWSPSRRALLVAAGAGAGLLRPGAGRAQTAPSGDDLNGKEGFIWLGNVNDAGEISSATVQQADGKPVKKLAELQKDIQYSAIANLYMRENMPQNDEAYFRGQRIVGILTINRKFTIVSETQTIKRPAIAQVWAKIHVGV